MARVFSAVDIDNQELKDELERVRDKLDLGFRPVSKHKMHITLQFFRDVDEEEIEKLKDAMGRVDTDPLKEEVKGVGCFPSREHIRVVWAGLKDEQKIRDMYEQLTRHEVVPDNEHHFKPHITMLRVKNVSREEKKKLQRTVREFEGHRFGRINVDKIQLFRSELKEGGSRYTELYRKEL